MYFPALTKLATLQLTWQANKTLLDLVENSHIKSSREIYQAKQSECWVSAFAGLRVQNSHENFSAEGT